MTFKHFIITRFNLSQKWDKDSLGNEVLDDNWLKKRFQLFENYCFPSLKSQTNKNFEWWVFFDTSTPNLYKEKIEKLSALFPNFTPKFKESYQDFQDTLAKDLLEEIHGKKLDAIITTRLDNDDVFSNDAVAVLQNNLVDYKCILEMPIGYNLEIGKVNKLRKMNYKLNPFISLLENVQNNQSIETVYAHQHGEWTHLKKINVTSKPQWIQVIHGNNVSNQVKGKEIFAFGALKSFTFNKPKFSVSNDIKLAKKQIKKKIKSILNR
ncbi:glycosyltransferase [Wocania ichthyoenteri]|uniref:glycosyltransferase n=1 Tax=Wocania ichthyoenteri TaxID=1230531 RepID=UPI00053DBD05|nr:glycosyltransferase [Wocania ichthyoenteri]